MLKNQHEVTKIERSTSKHPEQPLEFRTSA